MGKVSRKQLDNVVGYLEEIKLHPKTAIAKLLKKFEEIATLKDARQRGCYRSGRKC